MMALMLAGNDSEDDTLVALARGGDRAAFARLVERHYDFIYRVAYRRIGRQADAEDVAQDVCVRLGKAIAGFRGEGRLTTWLYTLTLNAAHDHARKASREHVKAAAYAVHALSEAAVADSSDDAAEAMWEAVRRLPAKQCEAVLLVYGEGLSHERASDVMGCAEATVSWHIHEAKKRLKVLMADRAGEG